MRKIILILALVVLSGCLNPEIGQDVHDIENYLEEKYQNYTNLEIRTNTVLFILPPPSHTYEIKFSHKDKVYEGNIYQSGMIEVFDVTKEQPTPPETVWARS